MRTLALLLAASVLALALGCGGASDPEAEATWETHTTDPDDDTAGGEGVAEEPAEAAEETE